MMHILDPQTGEYRWRCPECGETIRLSSPTAVCLVQRAGRCQGCRARVTFKQNPELVGFYLDFWARTNAWPQSDSWMDAMPESGVSIPNNRYPAIGMHRAEAGSATLQAA
jgi:hypothetical protein